MAKAALDGLGFLSLAAGADAAEAQKSHHERLAQAKRDSAAKEDLDRLWSNTKLPVLNIDMNSTSFQAMPALQLSKQQLLTLKSITRAGVPLNVRPALWFFASGGYGAARQAAPRYYESLVAQVSRLPSFIITQIDTDTRTVTMAWKQHAMLKTRPAIQAMSNVLIALLVQNPTLSYTRQLCHMVAFAIVAMGGPQREQQVFYTLNTLLKEKLYGYCDGQVTTGVRGEQEVLSRLTARKLPRVTAHTNTIRMPLANMTQPWLSGLLVSSLAPETCARVWDVIMVEGSKALHRTALALIKMYEQAIVSCSIPEVLCKVVDLRLARTTDAAALLNVAFKGIGSLPGEQVRALRQEALSAIEAGNAASNLRKTSPQPVGSTSPTAGNTRGSAISKASPSAPSMTVQQSSLSATLRRVKTASFNMAAVNAGNTISDSGTAPSVNAAAPAGLYRSASARRATDETTVQRRRSGSMSGNAAGVAGSPPGIHGLAPVSDSEEEGHMPLSNDRISDLPRSGSDLGKFPAKELSSPEIRSSAEDTSVAGSVVSSAAGPSSGGHARAASVDHGPPATLLPPAGVASGAPPGGHDRVVADVEMKHGMGHKRPSVGRQLSAMWSKLKWGQSKSTNSMASAPSAAALEAF